VNNILKIAKDKKDSGYSVLKIKMGEISLSVGIDLIREVRDIVGNEMKLVLDLNRHGQLRIL
jgi:L-alanine-DL-glutamate epimerase-like enolase superfamily enzyme